MSLVDSGLGWKCKSEYYAYDAGTALGWASNGSETRTYTKRNDGSAIVFFQTGNTAGGAHTGPVLLSTLPEAVGTNYATNFYSAVIDGVTWYVHTNYHFPEVSYGTEGWPTVVQTPEDLADMGGTYIPRLLELAGVYSKQDIPVQFEYQGGGIVRLLRNYSVPKLRESYLLRREVA